MESLEKGIAGETLNVSRSLPDNVISENPDVPYTLRSTVCALPSPCLSILKSHPPLCPSCLVTACFQTSLQSSFGFLAPRTGFSKASGSQLGEDGDPELAGMHVLLNFGDTSSALLTHLPAAGLPSPWPLLLGFLPPFSQASSHFPAVPPETSCSPLSPLVPSILVLPGVLFMFSLSPITCANRSQIHISSQDHTLRPTIIHPVAHRPSPAGM